MDEQQNTGAVEEGENTAEETSTEQTAETTTETEKQEEGSKETEKKPEESKKQEEEETPPTRKTKFDYILERKQKQLDKLREEKSQKVDEELKKHGVEEEISPDDEKLVEKVIEKRFGKYFTEADERAAEAELQDFLNTDPLGKYFKESEAKIRQWSRHPSRANLPLRAIALEIAGDKLLEVGAKLEREAAKKAASSQTGGGMSRKVEGKIDWANMSAEDFEKEKEKVMRGK